MFQIVKCQVVNKNATGLDVKVLDSGLKAFIPKMHLSDSVDLCNALWEKHVVNDIIETAMFWSKNKMPVSFY